MANLWLDLKGPILADTVYIGGTLVAKDVTIALPAVTPVTADFKAMGTYTAPILGQIEAMEASITKIGIDLGLRNMMKLESKTIEIRWAQDVKQADGSTKTEGCRRSSAAFLRDPGPLRGSRQHQRERGHVCREPLPALRRRR